MAHRRHRHHEHHDTPVRSRNATERAILDAARQALAEERYERLTMDAIAKRAFLSRTAVYFYFDNKRAVVDRLIQRAFTDMYIAASPYITGSEDPRRELRVALSRVVAVVNRDAHILLLAAHLSGREDRLPPEWAPHIYRFVEGAEARIARDQESGIAPDDISPRISAQALLAMVERHVSREIIVGALTHAGDEWTRGNYPRSFAFDPTNRFLYCCNQRGDNVAVFRVDRATVGLAFTGHYTPVGNPSCVVFLDTAGRS